METRTLVVNVIDAEGLPLADAAVTPVGMRSKEEPGSYYGWRSRQVPGINGGVTDKMGAVTISFPACCRDDLTTGIVIVRVEHEGSCSAQIELSVDKPRPIKLVSGTRVRLSAQVPEGVVISELFADVEHDSREVGRPKWRRELDGFTVSSFLPDGKYMGRLVGVAAGTFYFSAPVLFAVANSSTPELFLPCALQQGRVVNGRLDPSVPRPVNGGWVVAHITSPKRVEKACGVLAQHWNISVDVDKEGTFTLPALPEGTLEIIAGCDGYISTETAERLNEGIRNAQIMPDEISGPITIPMERTGTARITVRRPDGQPLADASVNLCPNQSVARGTSIIGARYSNVDLLRAYHGDVSMEELRDRQHIPRFWEKSDAAGVAVIQGLPSGLHRFYIVSDEFEQAIAEEHRPLQPGEIRMPRREGKIAIRHGQETSADVRLELKGTTSLSAAITSVRQNRRRCG